MQLLHFGPEATFFTSKAWLLLILMAQILTPLKPRALASSLPSGTLCPHTGPCPGLAPGRECGT